MQPGERQMCLGLHASRGEHRHAPLPCCSRASNSSRDLPIPGSPRSTSAWPRVVTSSKSDVRKLCSSWRPNSGVVRHEPSRAWDVHPPTPKHRQGGRAGFNGRVLDWGRTSVDVLRVPGPSSGGVADDPTRPDPTRPDPLPGDPSLISRLSCSTRSGPMPEELPLDNKRYHHSTRADLLRRLGRNVEAGVAYAGARADADRP